MDAAIFITTDPEQDLRDCGNAVTEAAEFARAYELAGARLAAAMRRDLRVLATCDEQRAHDFRTKTPDRLLELRDEIWQTLHGCVSQGARKGTYKVNKTAAQFVQMGRRYRAAFDRALAAPERDDA